MNATIERWAVAYVGNRSSDNLRRLYDEIELSQEERETITFVELLQRVSASRRRLETVPVPTREEATR